MNVAFRCDASLDIGAGHVMRCLTLADDIARRGGTCHFICRETEGNLISLIAGRGHEVSVFAQARPGTGLSLGGYEAWLTVPLEHDARDTARVLERIGGADWLVADHYAIDATWEAVVAPHSRKLMVIDDLANRQHRCDLLLDQNAGRRPEDYTALTAPGTQLLCGTHYALLRPEFAQWRDISLARRTLPAMAHILVSLGGVDRDNATTGVLEALETSSLAPETSITVVMGKTAPWLRAVEERAVKSRFDCRVLSDVDTMAQLMSEADLAIGAVGATSWERCTLGLPAIVAVLAENQAYSAERLRQAGAALLFSPGDTGENGLAAIVERLAMDLPGLAEMSACAAALADGAGCSRVVERLLAMENMH